MNRFFDNSYLQAVAACIEGQATALSQVETFARFLGEILIAEKFSFTADTSGSVFPVTQHATEMIASVTSGEIQIEHLAFDDASLDEVCQVVSRQVLAEIDYLPLLASASVLEAYPKFNDGINPHLALHSLLADSRIPWTQKKVFRQRLFHRASTANVAPHALLAEPVLEALAKKFESNEWTTAHTLQLTIAARMLAYDALAARNRSTYLPSSARAALHAIGPVRNAVSVLDLGAIEAVTNKLSDANLPPVIAAILLVTKGDPSAALMMATSIRSETKTLRRRFHELQQDTNTDGCCVELQQLRNDYQTLVSDITKGVRPPSFLSSLRPNLIFPGIPTVGIDIEKLGAWITYKRRVGHVKRLATLLLSADHVHMQDPFEMLRARTLVR